MGVAVSTAATIAMAAAVTPLETDSAQAVPQDPGVATQDVVENPANIADRGPLNTTGRTIDLTVPLRERVPLGQVDIRIAADDSVSVDREDLLASLSRIVQPEALAGLEALPDNEGYVALSAVTAAGYPIRFDPGALDLEVTIDAELRPEQTLNLGFNTSESRVQPDTSAPFAAFVSYQANIDIVEQGFDAGVRSPRVNVDVNGRLFNLISFENELRYDGEREDRKFARIGSRVIYDRPGDFLRFTGGDLLPVPVSFQDTVDILGIGVSKLLNEFRPDALFTASPSQEVTLREAATVTILVNGVPSRTIRLAPGNYTLADLPLVSGANNIELVIEDDAGGRRVLSLDFFEDVDLLAPGVDEYEANVGIRSFFDDGRREYFDEDPAFSGFYRRGITDQLTIGANLQGTDDVQVGGVEADLGTNIGLFSFDGAVSNADFGTGYTARLQYRFVQPYDRLAGVRRFDAAIEYRSEDFTGVESQANNNPFSWSLAARYSQPVNDKLIVGAGADYRIGRGTVEDRYTLRANASYRIDRDMTLNGSAGYSDRDGFIFGLTFFWRINPTSTFTARYDSQFDDASVSYFHAPIRLLDTIAYNVEAQKSGEDYSISGTATWRTNRGDLEVAHRAGIEGLEEQVTSLRARGSIGFADGKIAAGRFLTDSFAIVSRHPSLEGADVLIGSRLVERADARADKLGPALVNLSSYSDRVIFYDVPEAPPGYDLGTGTTRVYPWLHSGREIVVGSDYNQTVFGTLLDDRGRPVALVEGTARRLGYDEAPEIKIFTNREGRLGASGLSVGQWEIQAGPYVYMIEVVETEEAYADYGELRPIEIRERAR